jgi:hypothetical protein
MFSCRDGRLLTEGDSTNRHPQRVVQPCDRGPRTIGALGAVRCGSRASGYEQIDHLFYLRRTLYSRPVARRPSGAEGTADPGWFSAGNGRLVPCLL